MKLFIFCLICSLLDLTIFFHGIHSTSVTQRDRENHSVDLSKHLMEAPTLVKSLLRTKRQSHLSLCSYCCNCCKLKGCGYCCST